MLVCVVPVPDIVFFNLALKAQLEEDSIFQVQICKNTARMNKNVGKDTTSDMMRQTQTFPTHLHALRTHLGFRRFLPVRDMVLGTGVRSSSCDSDSVSGRRLLGNAAPSSNASCTEMVRGSHNA